MFELPTLLVPKVVKQFWRPKDHAPAEASAIPPQSPEEPPTQDKESFNEEVKKLFAVIDQIYQAHYPETETPSAFTRFKAIVNGAFLGIPSRISEIFYCKAARQYLKLARDVTSHPQDFSETELDAIKKITDVSKQLDIDFSYLDANFLIRSEVSAIKGPIEILQALQKLKHKEREKVEAAILGKQLSEAVKAAKPEMRHFDNQKIINALEANPGTELEKKIFFLVDILNKPFGEKRTELINLLNKVSKRLAWAIPAAIDQNIHPLDLLKITDQLVTYLEKKQPQSKLLAAIDEYRQLVWDHTVISSLTNFLTSPWRRYAKLNLDLIKAAGDLRLLNAVAFDETREVSISSELNNDTLEEAITQSFAETLAYSHHQWEVDPQGSLLNRLMAKFIKANPFANYNRSSREANVLLPQTGQVIIRLMQGKFFVEEIQNFKSADSQLEPKQISNFYQLLLEGSTLQEALKLAKEKFNFFGLSQQTAYKVLRELASLPILILNLDENQTEETLTSQTSYEVNKIRSKFPNANFVMLAQRTNNKLCLSISTNHDIFDGGHTKELLAGIMDKLARATHKPDELSEAPQIGIFPPLDKLEKRQGYFPVQVNVEATKFFLMVNEVAAYARDLKKTAQLPKNSFLSSPSFVMQLALIDQYRQMAKIPEHDIIGMLLGDARIDSDLDLARLTNGFDLKQWPHLTDSQKTHLLQILQAQFDNGLQQSNIQRLVRGVVTTLAESLHQPLNTLSQIFSLALKYLQGSMISAFSLPRFKVDGTAIDPQELLRQQATLGNRTAGPALTPNQQSAITICSTHCTLDEKNKLDQMILSIRIKNRSNQEAYTSAQSIKTYIESFEKT